MCTGFHDTHFNTHNIKNIQKFLEQISNAYITFYSAEYCSLLFLFNYFFFKSSITQFFKESKIMWYLLHSTSPNFRFCLFLGEKCLVICNVYFFILRKHIWFTLGYSLPNRCPLEIVMPMCCQVEWTVKLYMFH